METENVITLKKKYLILFGFILINVFCAFGQSAKDTIMIKKKYKTYFIQNGKYLTTSKLLEISKLNTIAYKEMKTAKINYNIGFVLGCVGSILLAIPIVDVIFGEEPNWTLTGIGTGLVIVSIPFNRSYIKHTKKAVYIYNTEIKKL